MGADSEAPLYWYRFSNVEYDEARSELRVDQQAVKVQPKQLIILSLLLAKAGAIVTNEELFAFGWKVVTPNAITAQVSILKKALGLDANGVPNGDLIVNVPSVGYKFVGVVTRQEVGRFSSELALQVGMRVPLREDYALGERLSRSKYAEVWRARHAQGDEVRVYKFSTNSSGLAALRREERLSRLFQRKLGPRDDFVRILGKNFEERPYFLECEDGGQDLVRWGDDGDRLKAAALPQRLELFLQIADAVAAAHSVSVLHNDLKATNILVAPKDEGWQVKVNDFGSGRLLQRELLKEADVSQLPPTQAIGGESLTGTVLSIAPEVWEGKPPTEKSDVYQLGLLLYQLAIGNVRKRKDGGWENDVADELLREDIAEATDAAPERRLRSADELADRVRNLQARRAEREREKLEAEAAQKLSEAVKRSRMLRPWIIAVFVIVLGAAISLFVSQRNLTRAYKKATALNELDKTLVSTLVNTANPTLAGRIDPALVDATKTAAAMIDSKFVGAESLEVRAALHAAMQEMLSEMTEFPESTIEGHKALAAYQQLDSPDRKAIVEVKLTLVDDLVNQSQMKEAKELMTSIDADIVAAKLQGTPDQLMSWYEHAAVATGDLAIEEANKYLKQALALAQTIPDSSDEIARLKDRAELELADNERLSDQLPQAEVTTRDLIKRQTKEWGAHYWRTYYSMVELGDILSYERRNDEAIALLTEAGAGLTTTLGPDNRRTVTAKDVLAGIYFNQEQYDQAAKLYAEVLVIAEKQTGDYGSESLNAQGDLARSIQYSGKPKEALPLLQKGLSNARHDFSEDKPVVQAFKYWLADCFLDLQQPKDAAPLLRDLMPEALKKAEIEEDWEGRLDYQNGRVALQEGRTAEALPLLEHAAQIFAEKHSDGRLSEAVVRDLIHRSK